MSQQEMNYGKPGPSYGYEGEAGFEYPSPYSMSEQKLSGQSSGQAPTAGQRLTLALVSLGMLMGMTFGLVMTAVGTHAPSWVVFPILPVLTLFSAAAVIINIVFNRKV
jgi:hypothetical protein